jgi:predicted O-methyltransferase YrrM
MSEETWGVVDQYLAERLIPHDDALEAALEAGRNAGLPPIQVAPNQGKLLMLLAMAQGARRILEIGTLAGYSAMWLARSLPPDGHLVTLEVDEHYAGVAAANLKRAGLDGVVDIRIGRAQETLATMVADNEEPFDFIFIDAGTESYPEYLEPSLQLSRVGTVIVIDNVANNAKIIDENNNDPIVVGVRQVLELVGKNPRLNATAIQTVGVKGHDGFALAVVTSR